MNGGLNFSNNQLLQSKPSSKMPSALTLPSFAQSWETTGGFPGKKPPEGSQAKMEISLEATIDLSKGERCQKGPKSWVDEWK